MVFKNAPIDNFTRTILASNDYQAVPLVLTASAKAGMPVKQDGSKTTDGSDAIGILLYDVDVDRNPNGAVIVDGIVDWNKCQTINKTELDSLEAKDIATKLPNIVFRDKDGKTYVGSGAAAE